MVRARSISIATRRARPGASSPPCIREADGPTWRAEYRDFSRLPAGRRSAATVRLASVGSNRFDLRLALSQVEINVPLDADVFTVQIPGRRRPDHARGTAAVRPRWAGDGKTRGTGASSRVPAFAKINLTLRVLGVRADGYHELRTMFQSLALHDTLTFHAARGAFRIECDDPACPTDRTNLVWRAADLVWRAAGRRGAPADVVVRIAKRIPLQAGLGGGSSDAAAAIRGLTALWRVDLANGCSAIAASLGADVPFFLEGGTALGLERGDVLFPLVDHPAAWVTLVLPPFGVSTKEAYGWFDDEARQAPQAAETAGRPRTRRARRAESGDVESRVEMDQRPRAAGRAPSSGDRG